MIREPDGVHTVFAQLFGDLRAAYQAESPDRARIERIFQFAAWCFAPTQNRYLRNAAAVSFYEHVPDFAPARADLAAQFTPGMWAELQPLLHRMLPPDSYAAFAAQIRARGLGPAPPATRGAT